MAVHICTPFRIDKNLGKAYNEAMTRIGEDDWNCFTDTDMCFLTPDAGTILEEYAKLNPPAGILTCFTNRLSTLSTQQLLGGKISNDSDIRNHIALAEHQKQYLYRTTQINRDISGVLMLISKKTWNDLKFPEDKKCLGVDTYYNRRIRATGKTILRMDGLYIWHTYRLINGIFDKKHLL